MIALHALQPVTSSSDPFLAPHLPQVLGSGAGARRRPLFFLQSLFPKKVRVR